MLAQVTGLQQTAQDAAGDTTFGWIFVVGADGYDIDVDGVASGQVTGTTAVVSAAAPGAHTIGVAPFADPTPPATLPFTIPVTSPPPAGGDNTPLIIAGVAGAVLIGGALALSAGKKPHRR